MRTVSSYILLLFLFLAALAIPANAQSSCTVGSGVNAFVRAEGYTEIVGDIVLTCTGGTPTAQNAIVPQIDILVTMNSTITSRLTATLSGGSGAVMNEALLLMDDPNSTKWNNSFAPHPIRNCGLRGEDSSPNGAGVCSIVSDGTPDDTYDGADGFVGTATCVNATDYGCGRPNVFQGRQTQVQGGDLGNSIQFIGIPFDPPANGHTRTIRIVNIRVNGSGYGVGSPFSTVPVIATIAVSNSNALSLTNTTVQVGQVEQGLLSQITDGSFFQCAGTATSTGDPTNPFYSGSMNVRVIENFATAFKVRNLRQILNNGTFQATDYLYNGSTTANATNFDQNVPGAIYGTETGFYFPLTGSAAAPANPPIGFGTPVLGSNIGSRFANGGTDTGITLAGLATQGTRISITVDPPPAGSSLFMPIVVALRNQANGHQTGVMVLTNTDANGSGPFTQASSATLPSPVSLAANAPWAPLPDSNVAVYEILFSDPNSLEYADITPAIVYDNSQVGQNLPTLGPVLARAAFAPTSSASDVPQFDSALGTFQTLLNINSCSVTLTSVATPAGVMFSPGSQNVTLSATVTNGNSTVNGGTIAFSVIGLGGPVTSGTVSGGNASVTFQIPGGTHPGSYQVQAVYSGFGIFPSSSDNTRTLVISKVTPIITWSNPADLPFGSALGSLQLNATANAAGTFLYSPPAGSTLRVGNFQPLSTTFVPTDAADYNLALASVLINVLAVPPTLPAAQLVVTRSISRNGNNQIFASATISNTGGTTAYNVVLTVARIGSTGATSTLPQILGDIPPGSTWATVISFPGTAGSPGAATTITLGGTYTGGSFSSTARITLP